MTLNAWGPNLWPDREISLRALMSVSNPDIICIQESSMSIIDTISTTLPYHRYVKDFDHNRGWACESNIFYNANLFEEVEHGMMPLNMPDYPYRGLFWMRLRVRAHPEKTILVSTCHLPWPGCAEELRTGVNQRLMRTVDIIVHLRRLMPAKEPTILCGDFNEDFHPRRLLRDELGFQDVFEALDVPPPPTHPARPCDAREDDMPPRTVDWIFTHLPSPDRVVSAYVKQPRTTFPPPSDHMPVIATIECHGGMNPYYTQERVNARREAQEEYEADLIEA